MAKSKQELIAGKKEGDYHPHTMPLLEAKKEFSGRGW